MNKKSESGILHYAVGQAVIIILVGLFLLGIVFPGFLNAEDSSRAIRTLSELSHTSGRIGKCTALIIGIDDYEDKDIPDLKTAVADAEAVGQILKERYGFSDIRMLKNRDASKSAIDREFREKIRSLKSSDSLLIYYAGHGEEDRLVGGGWWVPADARAGDTTTYFENTTVQKYLRAMNARHVFLVSDSCYSGTLFGESRALPPVINDQFYLELYNEKSRWGMTSGNKTPVSDRGFSGHSVFAYQFLRTLEKNKNPYITPREIYAAIGPVVRNNSEQMPLCRPIMMTGDQGGEFVFVASSSGAVIDSPAQEEKAILKVTSNVSGSTVLIDGVDKGSAPLTLDGLSPGHYRVKVAKNGYKPFEEKVFLSRRSLTVKAYLERITTTGTIEVTGGPDGAKVYVDGYYAGVVPATLTDIEKGRHTVKVSKKDYRDWERTITLGAGDTERLVVDLEKEVSAPSGEKTFTNSIGMKFVKIPAGSFMMGSPSNEKDREKDETQHRVTLTRDYYMQTTEVTQGQWKAVMGGNPSYFSYCGDNCPVEQVSWNDVQGFISKLNQKEGTKKYRLPTEAEWEYAARAGTTGPYAGDLGSMAWYNSNSGSGTHAVGQKSPNSWGLYDMPGNVWEWCEDWYGDYPYGSVTDPEGPSSGSDRVFRGGCWIGSARSCRSADRLRYGPGNRDGNGGFRLVLAQVR